jgi:hypothetical protein
VHFDSYNTQDQQKFFWPTSFALAKAYLDQLERSKGLDAAKIKSTRDAIDGAEHGARPQRRLALTQLAAQLTADLSGSTDQAKMKLLVSAVSDLAKATK